MNIESQEEKLPLWPDRAVYISEPKNAKEKQSKRN